MTCLVQIIIHTTVNSKEKKDLKKIKRIPHLPTLKLKNKSETDLFSLGLSNNSMI